jgi:catalase
MTDVTPPAGTTTDSGIPAPSDEYSLTVGPAGPIALHDHYVVQKMQHFNRERVPERVVRAKGSGAHGFFEVTERRTRTSIAVICAPRSIAAMRPSGAWRCRSCRSPRRPTTGSTRST